MKRFLSAEENGEPLTDCRELSHNLTASSSSSSSSSAHRHAALSSLQTRGPGGGSEPRRSALKRSRGGQEGRADPEEAAAADHPAAPGFVVQRRLQPQGRGVGGAEGVEMISAAGRDADGNNNSSSISEPPAGKVKEERKGKNLIRGWKRDRDAAAPPARIRKEKSGDDGASPPPAAFLPEHHLGPGTDSRIPAGDSSTITGGSGKTAADCGVKSGGAAIVVRRLHDEPPAAKKHRGAEKVGVLSPRGTKQDLF